MFLRVKAALAAALAFAFSWSAETSAQPAGQTLKPFSATGAKVAIRPFEIISLDPAFDKLVPPGTQLDTVALLPVSISEGPMWRNGEVWLSDQLGGGYAVSPKGAWRMTVAKDAWPMDPKARWPQGPNGQVPWKDGAVLITRQGLRDIAVLSKDGAMSPLVTAWEGKTLNSPNDLVVARDGAVWFTDPPFSVPGFLAPRPDGKPMEKAISFNGVFRVKDGKATPIITEMEMPNGIAFSPNGRTLYISGSGPKPAGGAPPRQLRAYEVGRDGALSKMRILGQYPADTPFGAGSPDGIKVDAQGHIWMIGAGGLLVVNPDGKLLGRLQLPILGTNLTFGDADYKGLYITTYGNALYHLRTGVKGVVPMYAMR